jgi:hypothetical protein
LKRSGGGTIYNNNKKDHHNMRSLHMSRFQSRSEFQTRSITREGIIKKLLLISKEKRFKLNRMMRLGIFYSYRAKLS